MNTLLVEKIANAVLYEGYILYPYRSSAVKNRQRWNFGVVHPRAYSETHERNDLCEMATECLATGGPHSSLAIKIRCLRLVERTAAYLTEPLAELPANVDLLLAPAEAIEIEGQTYESWQEAAECEINLPVFRVAELAADPVRLQFVRPATRAFEPLRESSRMVAGVIVRRQEPLEVWVEMSVEQLRDGLYRIHVGICNTTAVPANPDRECALAHSLLSAHTILLVRDGEFISLLDPPEEFQTEAVACHNSGTWPVLVGEMGERQTMLSSPIILYDYPQVAPESPGDLFDGAEIDEILSLRILALTDEEKAAMRRSDDRAKRILDRTETLPPEHFMKLHGVLRSLGPAGRRAS